jgi:hypothetical protein
MSKFRQFWCRLVHRPFWKRGHWSADGFGGFGRLVCCPACSRIWSEWR